MLAQQEYDFSSKIVRINEDLETFQGCIREMGIKVQALKDVPVKNRPVLTKQLSTEDNMQLLEETADQ